MKKDPISPKDYQAFFEVSLDLLCFAGTDGYFKKLNPRWTEVLGWSEEELYARPFVDFIHPEDVEKTTAEVAKLAEGNHQTINFENRYLTKSGKFLPFLWTSAVSGDYLIAVAREVSQIQNLQRETEYARRFMEDVLENLPNMVFVKEAKDLRFSFFNRAGEDLLGQPKTNLLGKNDYDFFPKDQADFFTAKDRAVLDSGARTTIEKEPIDTPKGQRFLRTTKVPVTGADGKPQFLLGISEDITERLKAEQVIEDQRKQLVQASKMSTLGEMASGIAHEINNPLAIIEGKARKIRKLLDQGSAPSDILEQVERIEATTERIAKIISGLRSFSRSSSADPSEACSLNTILQETLELSAIKIQKLGIDMRAPELSEDIVLEGRSVEISQVLLNLIQNAADAIEDESEKWIEIKIEPKGVGIAIHVTDSGPGIPEEVADRILEPFFTTKPVGKGSGLGLSISAGIVQAHKGTLRLDRKNPNTCFVIWLPLRQESDESLPEAA